MNKLLTRDDFRDAVFQRDGYTCVFCSDPAVDAHHIIDRALWPDQGYYIDNGASVCDKHHLDCEYTHITVEECRKACGIKNIVLPPQLDRSQQYDKWGNPVLSNGLRLRGELYNEKLAKFLSHVEFTHLVKYPRTPHLPWSPGVDDDDMVVGSNQFEGKRVVVTEKFDGENTSLYSDHIHARSLDSRHHPSRDWVKKFWGERRYEIPEGWRICGENVYAKHSIAYDNLSSYFLGFSIWDNNNFCLSWKDTIEWFYLLNITPVRVLYDGVFDENTIKALYTADMQKAVEGYVVRTYGGFAYGEFTNNIAKYVRKNHVQTDSHWMSGPVEPNKLRE